VLATAICTNRCRLARKPLLTQYPLANNGSDAMRAFELKNYDLAGAVLRPLAAENAPRLGAALAAMPPWSVTGLPAESLIRSFRAEVPCLWRFEIVADGELAGMAAIQHPFLHGPYLQLLAILPGFQGHSLGLRVLEWMEIQARMEEARQLWLCVSTFNDRAKSFYERFGFEPAAVLDKLASDRSDEIFMRKRLAYA
jgi:ribosomal protein S18 acetylase RimI-like enzyme